MLGMTFGTPFDPYGQRQNLTIKTVAISAVVILVILVGVVIWGRGMLRDRELAEFKNAQVEEVLRQKDEEIARHEQDLEDIQELNDSLQQEVEWARFQVTRREQEMEHLKAASSVEVQACLDLVIDPGFLP